MQDIWDKQVHLRRERINGKCQKSRQKEKLNQKAQCSIDNASSDNPFFPTLFTHLHTKEKKK